MSFSVGQTVGDYQVIDILGAGGMGTVYKVRHLISDRLEAMKLVLPELTENPELADRFMREIKVQARLSHPNIASLHNAFRVGNQLLMVMELIDGFTLHAVLRKGAMEPITAIDATNQILGALEYAHAHGVVHRDIKPANIMITAEGRIKLMDFGIARSIQEDNHLTRAGAAVGSVYYMSPEQVQGTPVDARADLYSVGVMLYELITGVKTIAGDTSWSVMNAQVNTIPRSPSSVNSRVPESLSLAILKAMEKSPEHRFQTAQAFSASLAAVRSRLVDASRPIPSAQPTELAAPNYFPAVSPTPPPMPTQTPVQSSVAATPASTPFSGTSQPGVQFDPERLEKLTRELASFVGPMAKVLVSRAAKKAQTWKQLYDALAPEVPEGTERKRFLLKRP